MHDSHYGAHCRKDHDAVRREEWNLLIDDLR